MTFQSAQKKKKDRNFTSEERFHDEKFDCCNDERNGSGLNQERKDEQGDDSFKQAVFTATTWKWRKR